MFYFFLLILLFVLVILPITISYLIYKLIKKKARNKCWRLIALVPILFVAYHIYTAFYPLDSFYKEEFEIGTGMTFPNDGKILYKHATYPDFFGEYTSLSIVKFNEASITKIKNHLKSGSFEEVIISPPQQYSSIKKYRNSKVTSIYTLDSYMPYCSITFFEDGETIEVLIGNW